MLWANEVPGGFVHTGIVDSQPQNTRKEKHRKDQEWFVLSGRRHVFGFININDCEITQLDAMDALDPDDPATLTREDRHAGLLLEYMYMYDVVEQEGPLQQIGPFDALKTPCFRGSKKVADPLPNTDAFGPTIIRC